MGEYFRSDSSQSFEPLIAPYRKKRMNISSGCRSFLSFAAILLLFGLVALMVSFIYPKPIFMSLEMVRINRNSPITVMEERLDVNWLIIVSVFNPNSYSIYKDPISVIVPNELNEGS